jgi:hypothetical protein
MSLRSGGPDPGLLVYLERTGELSSQEFPKLLDSPQPSVTVGLQQEGATPAERIALFLCSGSEVDRRMIGPFSPNRTRQCTGWWVGN